MKGLNRTILDAKRQMKLCCINIGRREELTNLLIVDDVLLFVKGSLIEWQHYLSIINIFCDASGMAISAHESNFVFYVMIQVFVFGLLHYFLIICLVLKMGSNILVFILSQMDIKNVIGIG